MAESESERENRTIKSHRYVGPYELVYYIWIFYKIMRFNYLITQLNIQTCLQSSIFICPAKKIDVSCIKRNWD